MLSTRKQGTCLLVLLFVLISSKVWGHSRTEEDAGGCPEGWLQSHGYCLYATHLSQPAAEAFCEQKGALEAQGICIRKPFTDSSASATSEDSDKASGEDSTAVNTRHECPRGWTGFQDYCFFSPSQVSKVCDLFGAQTVLGYCVLRVPSQVSTDFMRAVKRLDGSDYDMHRDTRFCCCNGGGMCK